MPRELCAATCVCVCVHASAAALVAVEELVEHVCVRVHVCVCVCARARARACVLLRACARLFCRRVRAADRWVLSMASLTCCSVSSTRSFFILPRPPPHRVSLGRPARGGGGLAARPNSGGSAGRGGGGCARRRADFLSSASQRLWRDMKSAASFLVVRLSSASFAARCSLNGGP